MSFRIYIAIVVAIIFVIGSLRSPPPPSEPRASQPTEQAKFTAEPTPEQKAEREAKQRLEDEENKRFAREIVAIRSLKKAMKNPASFDLELANRMEDGTLCVSYRATNSFNAIVPGRAVITQSDFITSDNRDRFVPMWNRRCANKTGKSVNEVRYFLR